MNATEERQATCEERIDAHLASRLDDLQKLWDLYTGEIEPDKNDPDGFTNEDAIFEYGLAFDYVAPKTFTDQPEGYWRYQLSWGGPSDEFRFYSSGPHFEPHRIDYHFMDWWDGASRSAWEDILFDYWEWFSECDTTQAVYDEAVG